eukprot:scaffold1522_cov39-Attheya_sp.AAC.1
MDADCVTTRAMIESQLGALSVEPFPLMCRNQINNELKSMGGMNIIGCAGEGKERLPSCAYTCGFTDVGGKELIIQNVHRSIVSKRHVQHLFLFLYKRHNDGHPLAHGHAIRFGEMIYKVEAPVDRVENTMIKAIKTLEPTRLYGLAGYNVLLIIPIGTKLAGTPETNMTTYEEVIAMANGGETKDGAFRPETNAAKLRICTWCLKSTAALGNKPLKKCSGCNDCFYCSREHQKLHWEQQHKTECMR